MARTVIINGTVITATETMAADVLIEDERIIALAAHGSQEWTADRTIDASGKYVMPGGVDVHTHMELRFGGTFASDTFESGSRAAAWGGTTTMVDFAGQTRGESMMKGLEEWHAKAEGECAIDYGFHMMMSDVNDESLQEMETLMDEGVTTFKLFTAYPGVLYSDDGQIFRAMQKAADIGAMILMHAENGIVIDVLREQAITAGDTEPLFHSLTRPSVLEAEATHRSIVMAELAGAPLYVVHMSAVDAVDQVAWARDRGLNVWGETCPQYLYLGLGQLKEPDFGGAKYVASPPVRSWKEGHQEGLWQYLATDDLSAVGTDHCPFCMDDHPTLGTQKRLGEDDFTKIPNGMPGIEDRMRLIFHGASEGRLSMNRFVEVTATAPAKLMGLFPQKGTLAPGSDADVVIWDPAGSHTMSVESSHSDVDYNAYEGLEVEGDIELVMARGRVLIEDGEYHGSKGDGRFLKRGGNGLLR